MFKKYIIHLHGANFFGFYEASNYLVKKIIVSYFKNSKKIICVSTAFKKELLEKFPFVKDVCVVHNCSEFFENNTKQLCTKEEYLLFAGRLSEDKGLKDALSAIQVVKLKYPTIKYYIAGNGNMPQWQNHINNLGLEDNIILLGWLNGEDKLLAFKKAKIFFMPSHVESFGIAVLDAMHCACPVVTTNVGGLTDLVKDSVNGFTHDVSDINAMAQSIIKIIDDDSMFNRMSLASKNISTSCFSTKNFIDKSIRIYEEF